MQFRNVIAQENIKTQLMRSVQENRVSHAQLFLGPEGCGNLAMALAYAQYINCENRTETDSCDTCPSCVKAKKFIHPDIHFTFPYISEFKDDVCENHLKEWREFLHENTYGSYFDWLATISKDNKQGNIYAAECVNIVRRLTLKTFESPYKILILWLPEFLEKEGNRLLKIIEEPPDNTVFIFVAHNAERILNTIMSRLQLVKFPRLSDYAVALQLENAFNLTAQQSKQIAAMSDGNYREALQLLSMAEEGQNTTTLRSWMECIYRKNYKELFAWNDVFAKWGRENQKNFFYYCIYFFREIILVQHQLMDLNRLTDAELKMAEGLGKLFTVEKAANVIDILDKSIYFVERNANAKILVTYISTELLRILHTSAGQETRPRFYAGWDV